MEYDPIETCPYDNVHRIRRSRMQFHIITCSKNFPASKMMQCPFDARHKVNQIEFEYHKNHCPQRESVIDYALYDPMSQSEQRILPIDVAAVGTPDENWDEGANVKSYNPQQAIKDKLIVRAMIGESKAKRKHHRLQERERFNWIKENSGNQNKIQNAGQSNSMNVKSEQNSIKETNDDADEETYKPLRQPFGKGYKPGTGNKVSQEKQRASASSTPENSKKSMLHTIDEIPSIPSGRSAAAPKKENSVVKEPKDHDSIIDELSKTVEELVVSHKKKTESLDEQINLLKKKSSEKKTKVI